MRVKFAELMDALEFASIDAGGDNQAWLDRRTGEIHFHSDALADEDPLPADIEDESLYLAVPSKRDLGLGRRVAIGFAQEAMPDRIDEVWDIFSRRGAYRRFRALIERRNLLERWYAFSNAAEEAALRAWCEGEGVELEEERPS